MRTKQDGGFLERRTVLGMAVAVPATASAGSLGAALMSGTASAATKEGNWSATEVVARIKAGDITAENFCRQAIKSYQDQKQLNAISWFDEAKLLEAARAVDKARSGKGPLGPLAGLPIVVKDNIDTVGFPSTAGTPTLKDYRPKKNAPVFEALAKKGAILFGKANMHELATGGTSNNPTWGSARNPYDQKRVPGGSSGGTASAIAARIVPAGLGTDTLGSVRIPASFCGIAALRPSIGPKPAYSLDGIVPLRLSMDTAGPMARTVADLALMHAAITNKPIAGITSLHGVRLGVPKQFYWEELDPEVNRVSREAVDKLRAAGAVLVDIDVSSILEANKVHWLFTDLPAEFGGWLAKHHPSVTFADVVAGIKTEPVKASWSANPPPAPAREGALAARKRLIVAYEKLFTDNGIAALVYPTEMVPAPLIRTAGDSPKDMAEVNGKPIPEGLTIIRNTAATAVYNAPGISLPSGLTRQGLPVGLELDGWAGGDESLLSLGRGVEAVLGTLPPPSA